VAKNFDPYAFQPGEFAAIKSGDGLYAVCVIEDNPHTGTIRAINAKSENYISKSYLRGKIIRQQIAYDILVESYNIEKSDIDNPDAIQNLGKKHIAKSLQALAAQNAA